MSASDNIQTLKNLYEAFKRGDMDAVVAFFMRMPRLGMRSALVKSPGPGSVTGTPASGRD